MTRSRIAMVLNAPGFGGVSEVVYQLLRRIPSERFAPHLFFLKSGDRLSADHPWPLDRFSELGVPIGIARGTDGKIGAISDLQSWIETHRIELVHTHSYRPNLYGRMAAALRRPSGLHVIAHYHNHYDDKWNTDGAALPLEKALSALTDAMIAVSPEVREHVASAIGVPLNRIEVVRNGVDLARFQPGDRMIARQALGLEQDTLIVGIVGRICEQKGHRDLVEAALRLVPELPRLRFVCFGDIEDRKLFSELDERIQACGLAASFTFVGHLVDVPLAFAAVDIIAMPSRWEGYPLVVAEAMACGRPLVATTVSAIPEMTDQGAAALLVAPRRPNELAEAIRRLVTRPELRSDLALRGIELSRAISWQRTADAVAAVYDRLLATGERVGQCR